MRFEARRVPSQAQQMLTELKKEGHAEIRPHALSKVSEKIEEMMLRYIERFDDLQDEVKRVMAQKNIDDAKAFRTAVEMLATSKGFPVYDAAFAHLNKEIEEILWDSEDVEELYADSNQLAAVVTPYLKAMTGRDIL